MGDYEDKVLQLFDAINETLRKESALRDASASEMVSAVFTLTRVLIQASIRLGYPATSLRQGVEQLLLECAEQKGN